MVSKLPHDLLRVLSLFLVCVWAGGCAAIPTVEPPTPPLTLELPSQSPTLEPLTSPPPQILPAVTAPPATLEPQSPAGVLATKLEGLGIDEFFEVSFRELVMRDPETVLAEGLADIYGLAGAELTNISDAYIHDTQEMVATTLEALRQYDRAALTPGQRISYDVYAWYLDDQVRSQEFMYHDYPATFFLVTSVPESLIQFFTDLHPLADKRDAEDYVARLEQVGTKFEQLVDGLQLREEAGIAPPKFAIEWALYSWRELAKSQATATPFYQSFAEKVNALPGISGEDKQALLASAGEAINRSVLPAFQSLVQYLDHQLSIATADDGVWKLPDGKAYYAYTLRHHTTTTLTPDQIHELGLEELERIHAEMRAVFDKLGYPVDASVPELYDRVAQEGGHVSGNQIVETYQALIQEADQNLNAAFDLRPNAKVVVVAAPYGGYYVSGSHDGSRPGAFYAGVSGAGEDRYAMPTLAYHEAIPGHHLQIAIAQEAALPSFRTALNFTAYTEGWALYAERLAWEEGWYKDDPYGNLGRLQAEAFRAARLVVDTGIHAKGWTFDQALDFFVENVGYERGDSINPDQQIARYIVWPGQSTAYQIGLINLLELRQRAMDQLGDRFDLKEFHRVVLGNGSMPLEILEQVVDDYVNTRVGQTTSSAPTGMPAAARADGLSEKEAATLRSLEQVDGYPLYTMRYYGDYGQAVSSLSTTWQVISTAQPTLSPAWGCSLFAALGGAGAQLYGRNFDWEDSPALLLFTDPPDGYASVSMVDIAYLGFAGSEADGLAEPDTPLAERRGLLAAPLLPFDGMNDQGLAVGMAAVPPGEVHPDPNKETVGSLGAIRQILDRAANVNEAISILQSYNIDMAGGPPVHYLIADRAGYAVLVEFYEGEMVLFPNDTPWHLATNFLRASAGGSTEGRCWRYDKIDQELSAAGGHLNRQSAMDLLAGVSQPGTQWSIVYDLSGGQVDVAIGRGYEELYTFRLGP